MNKLSTTVAFLVGAAIGGAAVWYFLKEKYAQLAEEEIDSVKEAYARKETEQKKYEETLDCYRGSQDTSATNAVTAKIPDKGNISDYARRIQNGEPMRYSTTVALSKPEQSAAPSNASDAPYVIPPEEFAELDGYTPISLTYFADRVLSDEYGIVIDDVEEIVGDALDHFGEYEDDSVFVRNDAKRCDYEILRDEREYEEFRKTLPPNI